MAIARYFQGASHASRASASVIILVVLSLSIMKLLFLLQAPYFPTINRVTYAGLTYSVFFFDPYWDSILLTVLAATAGILIARKKMLLTFLLTAVGVNAILFQQQQFLGMDILALCTGMAIILVTIYTYIKGSPLLDARWFLMATATLQTFILARWLVFPIYPTRIFGDISWRLNEVYASLQTVAGILVPALILLVVFSFVFIPNRMMMVRLLSGIFHNSQPDAISKGTGTISQILFGRHLYFLIFAFSFVIPLYPHIQSINPDNQFLNVDAAQYSLWMDQLRSVDSEEFYRLIFSEIQSGDRPVSLLIIYGIYNIAGENNTATFMMLPSILSLLLVSSVYFAVDTFAKKRLYSNLAAIVTLTSFQVLAGMYAGLFSNWLALVFVNLSIAFMLRYLERKSLVQLALLFASSIFIIFVHSATWLFYVGTTGIFLGISAFMERNKSMYLALAAITMVLILGFTIDQIKSVLADSVNTIQLNSDITQAKLGAEEFVLRWNNLRYLSTIHLWGTLSNATLLALALTWCLTADLNNRFNRLIISMFFVGSIPLIVGGFDVQSRFLYNMPFHIAAALLLGQQLEKRKCSAITSLAVMVILLDLANYLFRYLANMYFIAPPNLP